MNAAGNHVFSDTWEWDGTTWALRTPASPYRYNHAMGYDGARQRVVTYGGYGTVDSWLWDGASWQALPVPPTTAGAAAMAYDAARQRLTVFDGYTTWLLLP